MFFCLRSVFINPGPPGLIICEAPTRRLDHKLISLIPSRRNDIRKPHALIPLHRSISLHAHQIKYYFCSGISQSLVCSGFNSRLMFYQSRCVNKNSSGPTQVFHLAARSPPAQRSHLQSRDYLFTSEFLVILLLNYCKTGGLCIACVCWLREKVACDPICNLCPK